MLQCKKTPAQWSDANQRSTSLMKLNPIQQMLRITELPRAGIEMSALAAVGPWLTLTPRGDGHPVVVIPGFLASDDSTAILREYLKFRGYKVYPWGQGRNLGSVRMGGYQPLVNHVLKIYRETGRRVSLVGWSLGGVHALAVADRADYAVRQIITLGSPINQNDSSNELFETLQSAARKLNGQVIATPGGKSFGLQDPLKNISPTLPITTMYSRGDGVVPWQRSVIEPGSHRENIELYGSHIGLGVNPAVFYATADRLALPQNGFKAFHRQGWRGLTYPKPIH